MEIPNSSLSNFGGEVKDNLRHFTEKFIEDCHLNDHESHTVRVFSKYLRKVFDFET